MKVSSYNQFSLFVFLSLSRLTTELMSGFESSDWSPQWEPERDCHDGGPGIWNRMRPAKARVKKTVSSEQRAISCPFLSEQAASSWQPDDGRKMRNLVLLLKFEQLEWLRRKKQKCQIDVWHRVLLFTSHGNWLHLKSLPAPAINTMFAFCVNFLVAVILFLEQVNDLTCSKYSTSWWKPLKASLCISPCLSVVMVFFSVKQKDCGIVPEPHFP